MNKKIIASISAIILVLFAIISIANEKSNVTRSFEITEKNSIVGSWVVSEENSGKSLRNYPEYNFIIYENGSCVADGYSASYFIDDNTFTVSIYGKAITYLYDLSGDTLILKYGSSPSIYYKRSS